MKWPISTLWCSKDNRLDEDFTQLFRCLLHDSLSLVSFLTVYSTDQEDEALNRWKASLGLGSGKTVGDPNDPRKCVIKSLALV
jgi:hypothetical protein